MTCRRKIKPDNLADVEERLYQMRQQCKGKRDFVLWTPPMRVGNMRGYCDIVEWLIKHIKHLNKNVKG